MTLSFLYYSCVCVRVRACVCVRMHVLSIINDIYLLTNRETILRLVSEAKKHEKASSMVKELQEVSTHCDKLH